MANEIMETEFSQPTARILRLKELLMNAVPYVEPERARIITSSYQTTKHLPAVTRRAMAMAQILKELPVAIRADELIVGAASVHPRSVQIYPEFSCEWIEKEFATMGTRSADPFRILPETVSELKDIFSYWKGRTVSDLALSYMSEEAKDCVTDGIYATGNYLYGGIGHICADYGKMLKIGCHGMIAEAKEKMEKLDAADPDHIKKRRFYEAVIMIYEAVICFAGRYAKEAQRLAGAATDPVRRAELEQIAQNCRRVPAYGAENFYEACQSFWFTHLIIQLESNGHSVSPGRFDQYMYPYYQSDTGLAPEMAQELIDCVWVKFNDMNKIRDEKFAQAFAGYQAFQNLCVGGQNQEGFDASNAISYLCMEAAARVRMPSPSFSIRVWQGTPDEFLLRACQVVRLGMGVPAMYNDEVIIPALVNRGVTLRDARNYCLIGCVEPSIPGKTEGWHDSAFFNVARVLEITLNSGRIGNRQAGPATPLAEDFKNMEEVFDAYQKQTAYFVKLLAQANNCTDLAHTERAPLPYLSALVDDCMGRGKTLQEAGALYNFSGPQAVGVADAGDSLYAIQKQVFEDQKITMKQLKQALDGNFGCGTDRTDRTGCTNGHSKTADGSKMAGGSKTADGSKTVGGSMTEKELYEVIKNMISAGGAIDLNQIHSRLMNGGMDGTVSIETGQLEPGNHHSYTGAEQAELQEIRKILEKTPSFGNDIDEVDLVVRRCGQIYCDEVEKYKNPRGGIFHAGMYPVSSNVLFGKDVGALPDGRLAGRPLADGVSPRAGQDCHGPTAAANSVSKLDHFAASNGTLYNQKFLPTAVAGATGLRNFAGMIRSYFDRKGMHVQFNVVDKETLYAAQKNPEQYKDLIVRVAGYSAQFIVLDKEVQDDIINRTEHGL